MGGWDAHAPLILHELWSCRYDDEEGGGGFGYATGVEDARWGAWSALGREHRSGAWDLEYCEFELDNYHGAPQQ